MAAEDEEYALAIGRAIKTVDRDIIYVALAGSKMETAALKLGLRLAREGFADRQYEDDGNLASRSIPGTVLKDPAEAAEQVVRMVRDGEVVSRHGKTIKVKVDTVCVHGDEPTAVEVAGAVRKRLEANAHHTAHRQRTEISSPLGRRAPKEAVEPRARRLP